MPFFGEGNGGIGRMVEVFLVDLAQLIFHMRTQSITDIYLFTMNIEFHICHPMCCLEYIITIVPQFTDFKGQKGVFYKSICDWLILR